MSSSSGNVGSTVTPCPLQKKGGAGQNNEIKKYKNLSISCKHRICPPASYLKPFELVPDVFLPVNDEITVDWTGNDPKPPKSLTLFENGKSIQIQGPPFKIPLDNATILSLFPESYQQVSKSNTIEFGKDILKTILTFNKKRTLSLSGLPDGNMEVKVYNPDEWSLTINFPLPGRYERSSGTKWDTSFKEGKSKTSEFSETIGRSTESVTTKDVASDDPAYTKQEYEYQSRRNNKEVTIESEVYTPTAKKYDTLRMTNAPVKKVSPDNLITLTKNGSPLTINGIGILHFIAQLMKWIQNISEVLKDIPKAGAYMEYTYSIMEGQFTLSWGWKEYKIDHRAFMKVKGEVQLTLLDLTAEVGIGVSGFSVKFQAFASIQGILKINISFERTKPWSNTNVGGTNASVDPNEGPLNGSITGEIIGSVGARFEALYFVKIEAKVSTGVTLEGKFNAFDSNDPIIIEASLKFNGIKGTVTTSVGFADVNGEAKTYDPEKNMDKLTGKKGVGVRTGGEQTTDPEKEAVLLGDYQIGYWKWPDAFRKYQPAEEMTDLDIKRSIKEMLNGRYLNSGFWNGKKIRVKNWKTPEELKEESEVGKIIRYGILGQDPVKDADEEKVVDLIFKKIAKQQYFDRTPKKVQLFLSEVHQDLVPMMVDRKDHHLEYNYIEWADFKAYVNGKVFYALVVNNLDPAKEFRMTNCS